MEGIQYEVTFRGNIVSDLSLPVALDSQDATEIVVRLYTEDDFYLGMNDLKIVASLRWIRMPIGTGTGGTYVKTPFDDLMQIEIVTACLNPFNLKAKGQQDLEDWDYEGVLTWTIDPLFEVDPENC